MTHDELKDLLPAYALDALDAAEFAEVDAHVRTCAECARELTELRRVVTGVGLEAAPVTPPDSLREKVIARATSHARVIDIASARSSASASARPQRSWMLPVALAATVLIAIGALVYGFAQRAEVNRLAQLNEVMLASDVVRIDLKGQDSAAGASARAYWSASKGFVLDASNLPALPAGQVYQLWSIVGSTPTSAGVLTTDGRGNGSLSAAAPTSTSRPDAMGITIEPTGGSATPTMPIVLIGSAQ